MDDRFVLCLDADHSMGEGVERRRHTHYLRARVRRRQTRLTTHTLSKSVLGYGLGQSWPALALLLAPTVTLAHPPAHAYVRRSLHSKSSYRLDGAHSPADSLCPDIIAIDTPHTYIYAPAHSRCRSSRPSSARPMTAGAAEVIAHSDAMVCSARRYTCLSACHCCVYACSCIHPTWHAHRTNRLLQLLPLIPNPNAHPHRATAPLSGEQARTMRR